MVSSALVGTSRDAVEADGRRYAFADHHCFACGRTNPIGMHLEIELGDGEASTAWTVGDEYVGWTDKAHGGIVATLLDEVMCWAPSSFDAWAVTSEMRVRFRSPAAPGERLTATGRVAERRRRIYRVTGEVRGADGRLVAEGEGTYFGASASDKRELKRRYAMPPDSPAAGVSSE
ncbi:MAG: PaaI family thioesterase [Chloroflexota bacterium]|nr:PaaI family thioesterase [Chloroflexota bacterium]